MTERTPQKDDLSPESFLAFLNLLVEGWEREYKFYPGRRCAFDYANPRQLIAIEIEGGTWIKGRHVTGAGSNKDMIKYNAATRRGWSLFRYPAPPQIYISKVTNEETLASVLKRESWLKTVKRDIRVLLTGIEDGQRTLEDTCTRD